MASLATESHASTPAELRARIEAGREGVPFLVWRDHAGTQIVRSLDNDSNRIVVGRGSHVDVDLSGDARVSRLHAILEPAGGAWTLVDEGLSRHGSKVNGEPVAGRCRLEHGDVLTFGETPVVFLAPPPEPATRTTTSAVGGEIPPLTDADRRTLDALCAPLWTDSYAAPAGNRAIAETLCVSEARVKARLGSLFVRFGLDDLPQNQKRAALAAQALRLGAVRRGG